jgi:nucleoredoxin
MRSAFWFLYLLVCCALVHGAQPPMTSKEVSLMLRSGYSSPTVMRELLQRHFADTLDADKEGALVKAGASQDLLDALRSGAYALPAKGAAELGQPRPRQSGLLAVQAVHAPPVNPAVPPPPAGETKRINVQSVGSHVLYASLKGDLVRLNQNSMAHADDEAMAGKKLIALYFSAHRSPPCRSFTPQLVDFYNRVASQHPEFEVIFVSYDRSPAEMETSMREASMPWPALAFEKIPGKDAIKRYSGTGIPCLVLIDSAGKVLSDSYAGTQYLGPQKVLADLTAILAGGPGRHVAQGR